MIAKKIAEIIAEVSGVSTEQASSCIYDPLEFAGRDDYWKNAMIENDHDEASVIALVTHDGEPLNKYFYSQFGTPEEREKQGKMWNAFRNAGLWFESYSCWYVAVREDRKHVS